MNFFLDTLESLKIAWSAIIANKARGVLTTLGIIIGILAVTTTMSAFNGMKSSFMQGAGAIGADVLYVSRMPWIVMNDFFEYRNRPNLSLAEADALEEAFKGRAIVNPSMDTQRDLRYRSRSDIAVNVPQGHPWRVLFLSLKGRTGVLIYNYPEVTRKEKGASPYELTL